jgi:hypothetical protein
VAKVTLEIAERIQQCVLDCSIRRLTADETAAYLYENGLPSNVRTVKRYRVKIRESAQNWIAGLAKSKRADYIAEYRERIDEVRKCQRELWNIVYDAKTFQRVKIEAIARVLECTKQLVELYDCLPLINAIRDYGCGYDHNKDILQQQDHHTAHNPSIDSLA